MENQTIEADLTCFIRSNFLFGDESRLIGRDELLVETGVIDSTGILELIEYLEERFSIEVFEDETVPQNLGSISRLSAYLERKRQPSLTHASGRVATPDSASPDSEVESA